MMVNGTTTCCGAYEMSGVHRTKPEDFIRTVIAHHKIPIAVWYDNTSGYGLRIAKYIEKNGLGEVVKTKLASNKGSRIRGYMWVVPDDIQEKAKALGLKPKRSAFDQYRYVPDF